MEKTVKLLSDEHFKAIEAGEDITISLGYYEKLKETNNTLLELKRFAEESRAYCSKSRDFWDIGTAVCRMLGVPLETQEEIAELKLQGESVEGLGGGEQ